MKKALGFIMALVMVLAVSGPVAASQFDDSDAEEMRAYGKFNDGGGYEIMIAMELDAGSASTADMMLEMVEEDPTFLEDSLKNPKVYTKHKLDDCTVLTGKMDLGEPTLSPATVAFCADGSTIFMIMGTDREDVLDMAEDTVDSGKIETPVDYMDMTGAI